MGKEKKQTRLDKLEGRSRTGNDAVCFWDATYNTSQNNAAFRVIVFGEPVQPKLVGYSTLFVDPVRQKLLDFWPAEPARLAHFDKRSAASVQQESGDLHTPAGAARVVKRCPATSIPLINRSAASVQQESRDLQTPGAARVVKRCLAIIILLINRPAASVQQEGRDRQIPVEARDVKRCPTITICHINRSAAFEQEGRDLRMPEAARGVKRCGVTTIVDIGAIHTGDWYPSIKVQRDLRHVASSCRLKQLILAYLKASLTQRRNAGARANAGAVRHQVQARVLLKRNDALVVVESTSADSHVEPLDAQLRQSLDDGFPKRLQAAAVFPNLHLRLVPCQTRRHVHACAVVVWFPCLLCLIHEKSASQQMLLQHVELASGGSEKRGKPFLCSLL